MATSGDRPVNHSLNSSRTFSRVIHVSGRRLAPAVSGTGTLVPGSTDRAGEVTGANLGESGTSTVTFGQAYQDPPFVMLTPTNQNAASSSYDSLWVSARSRTSFSVRGGNSSSNFMYQVTENGLVPPTSSTY